MIATPQFSLAPRRRFTAEHACLKKSHALLGDEVVVEQREPDSLRRAPPEKCGRPGRRVLRNVDEIRCGNRHRPRGIVERPAQRPAD